MPRPDAPERGPDGPGGGVVADGPLPAGGHLDEGTAHAFVDSALSDEDAARVITHVAGCTACAALVAEARGLAAAATRILGALDDVPGAVVPAVPEPATAAPAAATRLEARRVTPAPRAARRWTGWPVRAAAALLVAAGVGSAAWRTRGAGGAADVMSEAVPAASSLDSAATSAGPAVGVAAAPAAPAASAPAASAPVPAGTGAAASAGRIEEAMRRERAGAGAGAGAGGGAGTPARLARSAERADAGAPSGAAAKGPTAAAERAGAEAGTPVTADAPSPSTAPAAPPAAPPPPPPASALAAEPVAPSSPVVARRRAAAPAPAAAASTASTPDAAAANQQASRAQAGAAADTELAREVGQRARVLRAPVATADAAELPAGAGCYVLTGVAAVARDVGVTVPRRVELGVVPAPGGGADDRGEGAHALTPAPRGGAASWRRAPADSLALTWAGADGRRVEVRVGPADARGVRTGTAMATGGTVRVVRARAAACAAGR